MKIRTCFTALALTTIALAEPVPVRQPVGNEHGFLNIRSQSGTLLGYGEYYQSVAGDRVTSHQILHFRDGSLDDETAVFTSHNTFQLVSDHHIQRGPFFKTATDALLESNGNFTLRTTEKDGKEKVETSHIDLPADISNGIIGTLIINFKPDEANSLGMVVPSGKGRLVKLKITPDSKHAFSITPGARRTADLYRIHIDIGGIAGVVAPIVGKQPSDITIWVLPGEVPLFVREQGQLSDGGPMISLELAGTSFK